MTVDELVDRVSTLTQQVKDLTASLTDYLHQQDQFRRGSDAYTHLVGQIDRLKTDLEDMQADLRQVSRARSDLMRDNGVALSVALRSAAQHHEADHQDPGA